MRTTIIGDIYRAKYGYIDKEGRTVIPLKFDNAQPFSEGLAAVMVGSKWGYINKSGALVIGPRFDMAWKFSDGVAMVKEGKRDRYIDRSGNYIW
jgi:hypothetical protein